MIVRNPNSATGLANRVDRQSESPINYVTVDSHSINADAFQLDVSEDALNWIVKEVALEFSAATARAFTISKLVGARIVANMNDWFWIQHSDFNSPRRCVIAPGLYTGTGTFAGAVVTALNNQADFNAASITFSVGYSGVTHRYSMQPSTGTIAFIYDTGVSIPVASPVRNISVAGPMMGFNEDSATAALITGDTGVDLGLEYDYVSEAADTSLSYVVTDEFDMDMDTVLRVAAPAGVNIVMTARVTHEVILSIR